MIRIMQNKTPLNEGKEVLPKDQMRMPYFKKMGVCGFLQMPAGVCPSYSHSCDPTRQARSSRMKTVMLLYTKIKGASHVWALPIFFPNSFNKPKNHSPGGGIRGRGACVCLCVCVYTYKFGFLGNFTKSQCIEFDFEITAIWECNKLQLDWRSS